MAKRTNYRFTYNNYTEEGEDKLKAWLTENTKYSVFGHEVAPTTGTPHLQGYFSLKKQNTMKTLQNKFQKLKIGIALLTAEASAEANRKYATKDLTEIFEHGDISLTGAGSRTDLKRVAEALKTMPLKKVAKEHPEEFIKYHSGITKYAFIVDEDNVPDVRDITVTLLYGDAGSGKTFAAVDFCKKNKKTYYFVPNPNNNTLWFDSYDGQDVLIIDDFKSWIRYHDLLRLLDCYKLQLPVKGGFVWAKYTFVFITSNVYWERWYNPENIDGFTPEALKRRIHNVMFYSGKYPDHNIVQELINKDT